MLHPTVCGQIWYSMGHFIVVKLTGLAPDSSILKVYAVVSGSVWAINQSTLGAYTSNIVQQNWISALAKWRQRQSGGILVREPSLSAHYSSIIVVPEIITNSSPSIVEANFYSAFVCSLSINQANVSVYTN